MKIHSDEILEIIQGLFSIFIAFLAWLGVYIIILNNMIGKFYSFIIYFSVFIFLFYCIRLFNLKFKNRIIFLAAYSIFSISAL